jgi:hypothetical protein
MVVEFAHCPAAGVNVCTMFPATAVETIPGFHVPEIPSFEVVGNIT